MAQRLYADSSPNAATAVAEQSTPVGVKRPREHEPGSGDVTRSTLSATTTSLPASLYHSRVDDGGAAAAAAVAGAYDTLIDAGVDGRRQSALLHLKNFNNWVKAVLIAEYAPRPCVRVLDLACGKLGDLAKWRLAGVREYCGVDISRTAIDDARQRFNASSESRRSGSVVARLVRADIGAVNLGAEAAFDHGEMFDAVSVQFALHYFFRSERRALSFFRTVADRLKPGGVFIGTIPDAALLVRRLRDVTPANDFGNSLFRVTFPPEDAARVRCGLGNAPYGARYSFFLAEAVHNVDEYLVPWPLLERLAAAAGLTALASDNFHAFYERLGRTGRHADTARNMRVFNCEGRLSADEWEVAGLYRIFAFQRACDVQPSLPPWAKIHPTQRGITAVPPAYSTVVHAEDVVDVVDVDD